MNAFNDTLPPQKLQQNMESSYLGKKRKNIKKIKMLDVKRVDILPGKCLQVVKHVDSITELVDHSQGRWWGGSRTGRSEQPLHQLSCSYHQALLLPRPHTENILSRAGEGLINGMISFSHWQYFKCTSCENLFSQQQKRP